MYGTVEYAAIEYAGVVPFGGGQIGRSVPNAVLTSMRRPAVMTSTQKPGTALTTVERENTIIT